MTNRAEVANRLAALPDELLPEVERSLDDIEDWSRGVYRLNDAERAAIRRGLAAAESRDFASEEELTSVSDSDGEGPEADASRYSITLRIWHPTIDPAEITRTLRLSPKWIWKAGEPKRTPAGKIIRTASGEPVGPAKLSYWTATLATAKDSIGSLDEVITRLTAELSLHRSFFARIRSEGGSVEYFIGWFVDRMTGSVFDHDLLRELGRLGIDLSFDVYGDN